ncbi:MAG: RNA polymerase sigma factor [Actinobacteria bacterium]|nr:RNA polymerase sigma factor [Actinomycetota bacterium]
MISTIEGPFETKGDEVSKRELIDIAARARRYELEAFERLFDLYFERLRRYAYYKTGDIEMAEDMAADVLTKALESIDNFKDRGGTIGAWLFGIARNLLAREREAAGKAETVELDGDLPVTEEEQTEKIVMAKLSHEELYEALRNLPEEQREVVLLRFMERHDVKTVARIMRKRPGAVRALQFRAISALREMFEPRGSLS